MALTKQSENNIVYLQVKHFSIWREVPKQVNGSEEVEVTNPKTGAVIKKYGYRYRDLTGRAVKLVKYDTERKYPTRYFGFKLHIADGAETYVLDMPYQSQILRRFLRVAHNIDWSKTFTITIFKGKKNERNIEETGIWFQQGGETVKAYYTRENPHGMPAPTQDPDTQEWDFKAQHRWLLEKLKEETIPDIEAASARVAPPIEPATEPVAGHIEEPEADEAESANTWPPLNTWPPRSDSITDDDVPF